MVPTRLHVATCEGVIITRSFPNAAAGEKVIVFGHHKKVLDGLQAKLGKAYQAVRIDGSTSMEARKQAMDSFQQRQQVRLAILSITAAGVWLLTVHIHAVVLVVILLNAATLSVTPAAAMGMCVYLCTCWYACT